jgi:hypothetical protein
MFVMDTGQREGDEDLFRQALAEGRATDIRLFLRKFGKFGSGFLAASLVLGLFLEGMPLHSWSNVAGPLILLVWMALLVMTAIYGSMAVGTWVMTKGRQPTLHQTEQNLRKSRERRRSQAKRS